MSQRLIAGLSTDPTGFAVSALDDSEVRPTTCSFSGLLFRAIVSSLALPYFQSRDDAVAQPVSSATPFSFRLPRLLAFWCSVVCGLGHPKQPLPDVRRADARSR